MVSRLAMYVIPMLAVGVLAAMLLGPGRMRPAVGARVWGAPAEGGQVLSLRVEGIRSFYGTEDGIALQRVELVARGSGGEALAAWTGPTRGDGLAEASLKSTHPLSGTVALELRRDDLLLASAPLVLRPAEPRFAQLPGLAGTRHGSLSVAVGPVRGAMASPFTERVQVRVTDELGAPVPGARVALSAVGADVTPTDARADSAGVALFAVKPLAHHVELTATARSEDSRTGRFEGLAPVVPGAIWLDPGGEGRVRLVSPSPRPDAFLSIDSANGRVFGALVPLAADESGFFSGEVELALPPGDDVLAATVAGDPYEQGAGTVTWPLRPAEGSVGRRSLTVLLDGVPAALALEQKRSWASRRAGMLALAFAGLAEMVLIGWRSRASQRNLEAHLLANAAEADASGESESESESERRSARDEGAELARTGTLEAAKGSPAMLAVLLVALVAFAFAAVAMLGVVPG